MGTRVVVIAPFQYDGRKRNPKEVIDMEDLHATIFKTVGKVKDYREPSRRQYQRRDMKPEGRAMLADGGEE